MIVYNNRIAYTYYHRVKDEYKNLNNYNLKLLEFLISTEKSRTNFFDRTGLLPNVYKLSYPQPFPYTNTYKFVSFEDLCQTRVNQLLELDKSIDIWWSGGIDSSCVLAAFIRTPEAKDRFTVRLSYNSIIESGTIFEKYIRNSCNWKIHNLNEIKQNIDVINVSGNCGNHIVGQGPVNMGYTFDEWEQPYQKYINVHPRMPESLLEYAKSVIDTYPGRLETFYDFIKFHCLFFRWHQDFYQPQIYGFKEIPFYDTKEFQQWAVYGNEPTYGNGLYKLPMKNIIYDVFPDKDYYYRKTPRSSVLFTKRKDWLFLLDNGKVLYKQALIDSR